MKEEHLYDTSKKLKYLGYGEWVEEPDLVIFEYKGIECKIVRIFFPDGTDHFFGGHLCGYIKVPEGHDWIGQSCDLDVPTHGGITFGKYLLGNDEKTDYWIGFDCAHGNDVIPSMVLTKAKYLDIPDQFGHFAI
ncbi:MAG TPA: hypothetical protein VNX68_16510, partial [Nitrosopumilaceae archaeon]|nr:hypothetical protein [Nitrosopumilaceae archaeon]